MSDDENDPRFDPDFARMWAVRWIASGFLDGDIMESMVGPVLDVIRGVLVESPREAPPAKTSGKFPPSPKLVEGDPRDTAEKYEADEPIMACTKCGDSVKRVFVMEYKGVGENLCDRCIDAIPDPERINVGEETGELAEVQGPRVRAVNDDLVPRVFTCEWCALGVTHVYADWPLTSPTPTWVCRACLRKRLER